MSPDLPEKLLGISIDDPSDRRSPATDEHEEEERERFVFFSIGDQRLAVSVDDVKTVTDLPEEVTRVPRAPDAIEGVVDLRGEITVLVEPRVHFPVEAEPPATQRLLVFDRPTDEQPAGIRVDDVHGVDSVPVSNIVGEDEYGPDDEAPDAALEHPLIRALVRRERLVTTRRDRPTREANQGQGTSGAGIGSGAGAASNGEPASGVDIADVESNRGFSSSVEMDVNGDGPAIDQWEPPAPSTALGASADGVEFEESPASTEAEDAGRPRNRETITDMTALLDVDRLLLASGQID